MRNKAQGNKMRSDGKRTVGHIVEGGFFQEETFELRPEKTRKSQPHLRWRNSIDGKDKFRDTNWETALVTRERQEVGSGWGRRDKAEKVMFHFQSWARPVLVGTAMSTGHRSQDGWQNEARGMRCSVGCYYYSHGKCPLRPRKHFLWA